ncbi:MAG TPA: M2 family metallopeptidase, partial [Chloroflexota bacterium]|nr:M2 family metallopeptidase [Chloroflexota bacterium]
MMSDAERFIADHVRQVETLFRQSGLAWWDAETTGTDEAHARAKRLNAEIMRIYADASTYEQLRLWVSSPPDDSHLGRQVTILYLAYASGQRDATTIDQVAELEQQVQQTYTNHRGHYDGRELSDNEIDNVLNTETESSRVHEAWAASKEVGSKVAADIIELVRLRNEAARRLGYDNHYEKSLVLSEIDPTRLFATLDELDRLTAGPFRREIDVLNQRLADRFGLHIENLRPWHYGDVFFQRPPRSDNQDLDGLFANRSLEDLAVRTFDGLGLDVRDILARSDLYARPGKNQHAFCTHIDRADDVRVLCNLEPNVRWAETLLHELGHGVYDKYLDRDLPFILRTPAHTMSTEAIAMLMGRLPLDAEWLRKVANVPVDEVSQIAIRVAAQQRLAMLIFVRWVLVMVHFERSMYRDPDQNLNSLWWDLVERYQMIRRPDERDAPDWAAKLHLALAPVYYQNYMLGELLASHTAHWLTALAGGLVDRTEAGSLLRDRVFRPGATRDWETRIVEATGEP